MNNKLRKPYHASPPASPSKARHAATLTTPDINATLSTQSRTMMYARTVVARPAPFEANTKFKAATAVSVPPGVRPVTQAEQYWAARALTAEALLSVKAAHQQEVMAMADAGEAKRAREVVALHRSHDERHAKLERLVGVLLACLVAFVSATVYILSRNNITHVPPSRWSIPSHFTIPILSPFTSVVEHETSVVSTRLIAIALVVTACLGYACFRHWSTHSRSR